MIGQSLKRQKKKKEQETFFTSSRLSLASLLSNFQIRRESYTGKHVSHPSTSTTFTYVIVSGLLGFIFVRVRVEFQTFDKYKSKSRSRSYRADKHKK